MNFRSLALLLVFIPAVYAQAPGKLAPMSHHTSGSFQPEVKPVPADFPAEPNLGRMTINKTLQGGIEGRGVGQMLTSMTATKGSAGYVAVEVITGTLDGMMKDFDYVEEKPPVMDYVYLVKMERVVGDEEEKEPAVLHVEDYWDEWEPEAA